METEIHRQRSSRRLRHEAEVKVFQDQAGSLEGIRLKLGLRPSQISEILKVHPSAWTRWSKANKAPPHVYQMLEWYMELLEWRGQHHPVKEKKALSSASLRREDLASYVPDSDRQIIGGLKPLKKGPFLSVKTLFFVWCIQIILWCILILNLYKGDTLHVPF